MKKFKRIAKYLAIPFAIFSMSLLTGCMVGVGENDQSFGTDSKKLTYGVNVAGTTNEQCTDLVAGQTIKVGTLCTSIVNNNTFQIKYNITEPGWELKEAHAWQGCTLASMPQTKKGNPKLGNFPHNSGDITGQTSHSFSVPMDSALDCNGDGSLCGDSFYVVAHAAVQKRDSSGNIIQSETAYGKGTGLLEKGSWAMFMKFEISCDNNTNPEGGSRSCTTAWAFGEKTLNSIPDVCTEDPSDTITSAWGWQIGPVSSGTSGTKNIYAGAGNNDISKGTLVGKLNYTHTSNGDGTCTVKVSWNMDAGFSLDETHLFIGYQNTLTSAPGKLGNSNGCSGSPVGSGGISLPIHTLNSATSDSYTATTNCSPLYIAAHAVACGDGLE